MFTPEQQLELNQVQANIKAAMADLQEQIDQLKQQLKEHDHGTNS